MVLAWEPVFCFGSVGGFGNDFQPLGHEPTFRQSNQYYPAAMTPTCLSFC